jgi:plasmid stabilization system protein ParE
VAEINWTHEAEEWLHDIHDYIANDSPRLAIKIVEGIYEQAQILKQNPNMGYRYHRYPEHNIRVLLYGHYRIAYLVKDDQNIDILGVFHGALDIDKYLFNN